MNIGNISNLSNLSNISLASNGRSGTLMLVIILHVLGLCGLLFSSHAVHKVPPVPKLMWMVAVSAPPRPPLSLAKPEQKTESKPQIKPVLAKQPVVRQPAQAPVRVAMPIINTENATETAMPSNAPATPLVAISAPTPAAPVPAVAPPAPPAPLVPPQFNAAYLNNPLPAYPPLLRRAGEQGRVVLRVLVNVDGSAGEVRVHHSSGSSLFDDAAQAAVRKWRFVPARRGETVVAEWVQVPIDFKLS